MIGLIDDIILHYLISDIIIIIYYIIFYYILYSIVVSTFDAEAEKEKKKKEKEDAATQKKQERELKKKQKEEEQLQKKMTTEQKKAEKECMHIFSHLLFLLTFLFNHHQPYRILLLLVILSNIVNLYVLFFFPLCSNQEGQTRENGIRLYLFSSFTLLNN